MQGNMETTANNKSPTSHEDGTIKPNTYRATSVSPAPTDNVVQVDELIYSKIPDPMVLSQTTSTGRNSLRSSLIGLVHEEFLRSVFEQRPDETFTHINEKFLTDRTKDITTRASRKSSVDHILKDMILKDMIPFDLENECDKLCDYDEDGTIFCCGSNENACGSCKDIGNAAVIAPDPFCDGSLFKNTVAYCQIPKVTPQRPSRESSIDSSVLDMLLNLDVSQHTKDQIPSFLSTNLEVEERSWLHDSKFHPVQDNDEPRLHPILASMLDGIVPAAPKSHGKTSPSSKKRKRIQENASERVYVGTEYRDTDVLCGRGESVNRHPGHKLFHQEKQLLKERYLGAGTARKEKTVIAQKLVTAMQEKYQSRFLDYCKVAGQWYIISTERALEKAKQVLREASFTSDDRKEKRHKYYQPKKPRHEEAV